jgi:hypothetical protein
MRQFENLKTYLRSIKLSEQEDVCRFRLVYNFQIDSFSNLQIKK